MRRRLLLGAAVTLAGCGFELKKPPELSFKTIQLTGFGPRSPLAAELKTNIDASSTTKVVEAAALATPEFKKHAEGRSAKKVIVVPGRLVNIVV